MRVIGLTGGIASGKSTAARILERFGVPVIDADRLAREVVEPGAPAFAAIVAAFGAEVVGPDGALDRARLGAIVFSDPAARRRLEDITHPAIGARADELLARYRRDGEPVVIYMAPLLIEAGVTGRVDEIWVVYVDRETQASRLCKRDGISRQEAVQRIESQMPMEEKAARGRLVIDNRGTPEELERQVLGIWEREIRKQGSGTGDQGPGKN